jgi:hypothetical protein
LVPQTPTAAIETLASTKLGTSREARVAEFLSFRSKQAGDQSRTRWDAARTVTMPSAAGPHTSMRIAVAGSV